MKTSESELKNVFVMKLNAQIFKIYKTIFAFSKTYF